MRLIRPTLLVLALAVAAQAMAPQGGSGAGAGPARADVTNDPFWGGISDLASFQNTSVTHLTHAQTILDQLIAVQGPRTVANTLRPYDDIMIELGLAQGGAGLMRRLHGDKSFRDAAEQIVQKVSSFQSALSMNRLVYDALSRLDLSSADAEARHYVDRELRGFRIAGVDKDETARRRLQELRAQLVTTTQEFNSNIDSGAKKLSVPAASLSGLPADFIARHPADASGFVTLTTGDADARPVLTYAQRDDLRRQMYVALNTIAYPVNNGVLIRMLRTRAEIARLAGFPSWAEYDMAPRMSGSVKAASAFIDRVVAASESKARREFDALLRRKRQDVPGAATITAWESSYYSELVRRAEYDFDSQQLRPYFAFQDVKRGLLEITNRLFGVSYRPAPGTPVWHSSVEPYELVEDGRVVGRFYLDLHPRAEKRSNGAAVTTIRRGVAGRQIPEVVLVAAFPEVRPGDPGLMTHEEVKSFFHEFGHVLQNLLAGRRPWIGTSGGPVERDFNEAPSQMLEEWTMNPGTLATFARHHQTGKPVPAALVEQMRRAGEFGQALNVRSQMSYAKLSLSLHDRDPESVDAERIGKEIQSRYLPYAPADGTHFELRFTHLANSNYSASYYTYMWSLVIAKDMFSMFDKANLLAPDVARRYRDTVLTPGASKPAAMLVQDFLKRPFNAKAWETWLNAGS